MMKVIWKIVEAWGEARAAAYLTRQGRITEAKALYK